jgi:hypothetical protein
MRYVNVTDIIGKTKIERMIRVLEKTSVYDKNALYFLESLKKGDVVFETDKALALFEMTRVLD